MLSRFDLLIFEDAREQKERREKQQKEREKRLKEIEELGSCEGFEGKCENKQDIEWTPARTFYSWNVDEEPLEDPNRDIFLCDNCYKGYNDYWDETWKEYNAGRL
jgi:hypothetical protein